MRNLNHDSQYESMCIPYDERRRICRKTRTFKNQLRSCACGLFLSEVYCTAEANLFDDRECKTKVS